MMDILQRMPAEIFNLVLDELLGTPELKTSPQDSPSQERTRYVLHTAILRVNKNINVLAKSFLDRKNKWIVVEIDRVELMLPWARGLAPMFVIYHTSSQVLPTGAAFLKIESPACYGRVSRTGLSYGCAHTDPNAIIIVHAKDIQAFFRTLRTMDLSHFGRCLDGDVLPDAATNGSLVIGRRGNHGLKVSLYTHTECPTDLLSDLLKLLSTLHGPLNEVTILGQGSQTPPARRVEDSIGMKRAEWTISETIALTVFMKQQADEFHLNSRTPSMAGTIYRAAHSLILQWAQLDATTWMGPLEDWIYYMLDDILINRITSEVWLLRIIRADLGGPELLQLSTRLARSHGPGYGRWVRTMLGLHQILCAAQETDTDVWVQLLLWATDHIQQAWSLCQNSPTSWQPSVMPFFTKVNAFSMKLRVVLLSTDTATEKRAQLVKLIHGFKRWWRKTQKIPLRILKIAVPQSWFLKNTNNKILGVTDHFICYRKGQTLPKGILLSWGVDRKSAAGVDLYLV